MKYGFIGCGNMGSAIAKALQNTASGMVLSDRSGKAAVLAQSLGCEYASPKEAAANCDALFLAVKPQMMEGVLQNLQSTLLQSKPVLITMAAGLTMEKIAAFAGGEFPVIRIMPNTPVAVGKGVVLYCRNSLVSDEVMAQFLQDMRCSGELEEIPESLFDAAGTVSGCGPAYCYMFLESMADGAVACGVPRAQALRYAAATMAGAAQMVLSTGEAPGALKDAVCSPGGSTIAGVRALEQGGMRSAVIECVIAASKRNQELGK